MERGSSASEQVMVKGYSFSKQNANSHRNVNNHKLKILLHLLVREPTLQLIQRGFQLLHTYMKKAEINVFTDAKLLLFACLFCLVLF